MDNRVITVSQLNGYLKDMMDGDGLLQSVMVTGEISNYKVYPSGHHYFSLKDSGAALRCVMFRASASRLRFAPANGMKVIAAGRVSVFPRDGAYQLYTERMTPDGAGDLAVAFEQLKEKLRAEGLFDPAHKKPLPRFPKRIAVITSSAGAAVRDIIRVLRHRYPLAEVVLLPVRVQGEEAPAEIVSALRYANRWHVGDLIITGRGGGSIEDLWAFNDERVARAIYASEIPVISAVGHEPDFTISDFVADLRAATPSNAAELAVPDAGELRAALENARARADQSLRRQLERSRKRLDDLCSRRVLQDPMNYLADRRVSLDHQQSALTAAYQQRLSACRQRYIALASKLDALSPLKILGRGYAIARKTDGSVVRKTADVLPGDRLTLRLSDGCVACTADE